MQNDSEIQEIKQILKESSQVRIKSGQCLIWLGCIGGLSAIALKVTPISQLPPYLVEICAAALSLIAIAVGIIIVNAQARLQQTKLFNFAGQKMFRNLLIPFLTSGIVCCFVYHSYGLDAALTGSLIFYGMFLLIMASYSVNELKTIAYAELIFGMAGLAFPKLSLLWWAGGFALTHLISGIVILYQNQERYAGNQSA